MQPRVLLSPEQAQLHDWVIVATKAYDAGPTAAWLPHLVGAGTRVAVLQNGVEHVARFAATVPAAQIIPVVVSMPVERVGPGQFRQRRKGQLLVAANADGDDFAKLFLGTGMAVVTSGDFRTEAWKKLALNCAGAISALVLKPASVAQRAPVVDIMRALIEECVAVGRAEGADLPDALIASVLDNYRMGPGDAINSMHADRLAGRPMEIDARNGVVVRLGRQHGIQTPANAMIVTLLEAAE